MIDRSLDPPGPGGVVATHTGRFLVRRLVCRRGQLWLLSSDGRSKPLPLPVEGGAAVGCGDPCRAPPAPQRQCRGTAIAGPAPLIGLTPAGSAGLWLRHPSCLPPGGEPNALCRQHFCRGSGTPRAASESRPPRARAADRGGCRRLQPCQRLKSACQRRLVAGCSGAPDRPGRRAGKPIAPRSPYVSKSTRDPRSGDACTGSPARWQQRWSICLRAEISA